MKLIKLIFILMIGIMLILDINDYIISKNREQETQKQKDLSTLSDELLNKHGTNKGK